MNASIPGHLGRRGEFGLAVLRGAGLGLRRSFLDQALALPASAVDFWEIALENWIGVGGPEPLDEPFIDRLKESLDEHRVHYYAEHLSYCSDGGHLYDLMPIPFTEDAARSDYMALKGKAAWAELADSSLRGVLRGSDRILTEVVANLIAEFRRDPDGFPVARLTVMFSALGPLGLSPADRQKLAVPPGPDENPLNEF